MNHTTDLGGPTKPPGPDSYIGQVFGGKYKILQEISQGGMGRIFRAEQISLKRAVAIKMVTATHDDTASQRFLLEASLTANLDHPNIVQIFDFGRTQDGVLFLVMELLAGENLRDWVAHQGPMSVHDALAITQQLCGALSVAHEKNVIHRDIKPSNIIVSRRAGAGITAKLIDFGLVKNVDQNHSMSRTGMLLGTPMFMAPEQITASGVDDRVDIYALGLTLFYALTGEFPYPERGLNALIHAQLNEELRPVTELNTQIDPDHMILWILRSAVAKDPQNRFQNTLQMLETIQLCMRCLDADEFPTVEIENGTLRSDSEVVQFNPDTPSRPLVDPTSYVKDGSAISKNYADSLYMSGMVNRTGETFAVSSNTSLAIPAPLTTTGEQGSPRTQSRSVMFGLLLLAAIGLGAVLLIKPGPETPAPKQAVVTRSTVEVQTVPEGADVLRDGKLIGSTPFSILVDKDSTLTVELRLKGHEPRSVELSSNRPSVVVRLNEIEATAPPTPAAKAKAIPPARRHTPQRTQRPNTRRASPPAAKRKSAAPAEGPRDPWAD